MAEPNFDIEEQRVRIHRRLEESEKFAAEQRKLTAEAAKLTKDARFSPFVSVAAAFASGAGFVAAVGAFYKLLLQ